MAPTVILEIRVRGPVSEEDAGRLGFTAETAPTATVLRGSIVDTPALHGALDRILADGLEVIDVRRLPS